MRRTVLIKNAQAIVTCDEHDSIFYDSDMLIEGPRLVRIGDRIDTEAAATCRRRWSRQPMSF